MTNLIYKILLIEEDPVITREVKKLLHLDNYQVYTTAYAAEGIKMSRQYKPDLIICNINLRDESGYHFLIALRNDLKLKHIPFIFINGKDSKDDIRMGMNLGADDYLTAPFKSKELLLSVKSRLDRFDIFNTSMPHETKHTTIISVPVIPQEINNKLSKTEFKIITMIAEGMSTKEIAGSLNISLKTVENHRHNISKKLNLSGHNSLVRYAIKNIKQEFKILD